MKKLLIILIILAFVASIIGISAEEYTLDDLAPIAAEVLFEIYQSEAPNVDVLADYYANSLTLHWFMDLPDPLATQVIEDPAQFYANWGTAIKTAFPDAGPMITDVVFQDSLLVLKFDWLGTYTGSAEFEGMVLNQPNEKQYSWDALVMYRFEGNKIAEEWLFIDGIEWIDEVYFGGELGVAEE